MSREFYVPCQPYAYPIRSRLMSGGIRFKSMMKWRRASGAKEMETLTMNNLMSGSNLNEPVSITNELPQQAHETELINQNNETSESHAEIQENKSNLTYSVNEENFISNPFDPGTSSFSTVGSTPSYVTAEDTEITSFTEITNPINDSIVNNELNPVHDDETLSIPSTLMEVQLNAVGLAARILDVVPILYIENGSLNSSSNTRSTRTEESFASNSGSEDSAVSSNSGIIEIVSGREDSHRRFEDDYVRPYYDLTVRPCGSGSAEGVVSVNGVVGGMDCMPLRPGPFHYLISEQAKSLVALQELQNEVGALLEFRDLVIETFPNLRDKMAVTAGASTATGASSPGNGTASVLMSSSQSSHIPLPLSSQSPSSRRMGEWEPGKVRRRVAQSRENESSSSSLPRSRSNSHSGGNKHSATVQDSGFSTETSSKDSASTAIPRAQSPSGRPVLDEAEDELWNLLDVIHRKGVRLREEVESLQGRLESVAPEELEVPSDILDAVRNVSRHSERLEGELLLEGESDTQVVHLQREKLQLLDKVAELEAETISSRARAQELQSELAALSAIRSDLEARLRGGPEAGEDGILAPGAHRIQPIEPTAPTNLQSPRGGGTALNIRSKGSAFASVHSGAAANGKVQKNRFRTRTIEKNVLANVAVSRSIEDVHVASEAVNERRARLGALDSVLVSPMRLIPQVHRAEVDTRKIAAILRERSPLELQRHLITTTVHNQVLQKRIDEVEKSSETLSERLGKAHEENEDLRFQLAERNIELEGTRARVRVLERLQQRPITENDADDESEPQGQHHGVQQCSEPGGASSSGSGSTSATSQGGGPEAQLKPSPRRRPSRIPLLGATKSAAPKPPSAPTGHRRNDSRDSLKSLGAQRPNGNPSLGSGRLGSARLGRDSSRESFGKNSLPKAQGQPAANRSLHRNGSAGKDSLGRQPANGSLPRPRDSLESGAGPQTPGTPPRRPPAPARRSQSQAARSASATVGDSGADTGKSMQSSNPPSSWLSSEVSLYPDSLNSIGHKVANEDQVSEEGTSRRVEFIIGSPTRKRPFKVPWTVSLYFDSIDTGGTRESLADEEDEDDNEDEYPPSQGEALADRDSLECDEGLASDS